VIMVASLHCLAAHRVAFTTHHLAESMDIGESQMIIVASFSRPNLPLLLASS
jgi:hypothetical protein